MNPFDQMGDWGYCKVCHRLILMLEYPEGLLPDHNRALTSLKCEGSATKPTKPKEQPW